VKGKFFGIVFQDKHGADKMNFVSRFVIRS
jgi:hypothetical protein